MPELWCAGAGPQEQLESDQREWNADATARCAERAEADKMSAHADRGVFLACSALSESIMDAVRHGDLSIVDETAGVTS